MINKAFSELIKENSSWQLIKDAFKEIKPERNKESIVFIIISLLISGITAFSTNTVQIFTESVDKLFDVQLAIFGIAFTAFSIILTFSDDNFIKRLSEVECVDQTYLTRITKYYCNSLFLYFIASVLSLIILLFMNTMNNDFYLFSSHILNNTLAFLLIDIYYWFSLRVIWELKSVIYNTYSILKYRILDNIHQISKKEQTQEKAED